MPYNLCGWNARKRIFHTTVVGLTNSTDSTQCDQLYFDKSSHVLAPTIAKFGAVHEARDDKGDLF